MSKSSEKKLTRNQQKEKEAEKKQDNLKQAKKVIEGRKAEFVQKQNNLRETFLLRMLKQSTLATLAAKIKLAQENGDLEFQLGAEVYNVDIWIPYYNLELHKYKELISREEYLKQALKVNGLTDQELNTLLVDGKIKKGIPK